MSEFQIYQFKSIDRPLTDVERKEVGTWSSRATPTATSATFTYAYGDFPKDPEKVMEKYFDAMIYTSSWGTKRLMFRLPKDLVNAEALSAYTFERKESMDYITLKQCKTCYVLDIYFSNEEGSTWLSEDDDRLDDLAPLRDDILEGDYRALYLIWQHFAQYIIEEEDMDEEPAHTEPPVPANISKPTPALEAFVEFFEISDDIVRAAQAVSPVQETPVADYSMLIAQLPENERNEWLLRFMNEEPRLALTFKKRLHQLT